MRSGSAFVDIITGGKGSASGVTTCASADERAIRVEARSGRGAACVRYIALVNVAAGGTAARVSKVAGAGVGPDGVSARRPRITRVEGVGAALVHIGTDLPVASEARVADAGERARCVEATSIRLARSADGAFVNVCALVSSASVTDFAVAHEGPRGINAISKLRANVGSFTLVNVSATRTSVSSVANAGVAIRFEINAVGVSGAVVVQLAVIRECADATVAKVSRSTHARAAPDGIHTDAVHRAPAVLRRALVHVAAGHDGVSCEASWASASEGSESVGAASAVSAVVVRVVEALVHVSTAGSVTLVPSVAAARVRSLGVRASGMRVTSAIGSALVNICADLAIAGIARVAGASVGAGDVVASASGVTRVEIAGALIDVAT